MEVGGVDAVFAPPLSSLYHSLLMAGRRARQAASPFRQAACPARRPQVGIGCAFAGRCPWQAGKICEEQAPPWRAASSGSKSVAICRSRN